MVGGQWYQGPYNVVLFVSSITAQGFTFPAGGKVPSTFTVTLPASFGLVQGEVGSGALFDVNVPSGELVLTFDYYPAGNGYPASYYFANAYYKAQGIAGVPEPGAIFLMATGLAGMVGAVRRKRGRLAV